MKLGAIEVTGSVSAVHQVARDAQGPDEICGQVVTTKRGARGSPAGDGDGCSEKIGGAARY